MISDRAKQQKSHLSLQIQLEQIDNPTGFRIVAPSRSVEPLLREMSRLRIMLLPVSPSNMTTSLLSMSTGIAEKDI